MCCRTTLSLLPSLGTTCCRTTCPLFCIKEVEGFCSRIQIPMHSCIFCSLTQPLCTHVPCVLGYKPMRSCIFCSRILSYSLMTLVFSDTTPMLSCVLGYNPLMHSCLLCSLIQTLYRNILLHSFCRRMHSIVVLFGKSKPNS